jgi:NTP pyrophosphatase (non-canonical NTP hydrolase)
MRKTKMDLRKQIEVAQLQSFSKMSGVYLCPELSMPAVRAGADDHQEHPSRRNNTVGLQRWSRGKKMSYANVEMKIVQWSEARRIIQNSTAWTQLLKGFSEMGELADATIKDDKEEIVDAVGDVMVCLVNYCAIQDIDLVSCMDAAYSQIKDRKGTLLPNGVFVKE